MHTLWIIILLLLSEQLAALILIASNHLFAMKKYKKRRVEYFPKVLLIVPCKGIDADFEKNIGSLFAQDYPDFLLWFVVESEDDAAFSQLCRLTDKLTKASNAQDVQVLVAGKARGRGQKIHNMLYAYEKTPTDVEVLAFADSDACVRKDWLRHLVHPLRLENRAVASGYRWFVPLRNNLATIALSAVNAKIAQLLGNTRRNHCWGGSMAVKVQTFRELQIDKIWPQTLSDDLTLSMAARRSGKKVEYVPACLVATYQKTDWPSLFEFARRQFIITRIFAPITWWFGLIAITLSIVSLWSSVAAALYAAAVSSPDAHLFTWAAIAIATAQLARALLRQRLAAKLLKEDWPRLRVAAAADIFFFWLWAILLFIFIASSAVGRTITWRGVRYRLIGPTETAVLES